MSDVRLAILLIWEWGMCDRGSNAKFQQNITIPHFPVFESTLTGQASSTFLVICQFFQR